MSNNTRLTIWYDNFDGREGTYRIKDCNKSKALGEIIWEDWFDSCHPYEICQLALVKQNEKHYLMGTSRNGTWYGYKLSDKGLSNFKKSINKFDFFEMLGE